MIAYNMKILLIIEGHNPIKFVSFNGLKLQISPNFLQGFDFWRTKFKGKRNRILVDEGSIHAQENRRLLVLDSFS